MKQMRLFFFLFACCISLLGVAQKTIRVEQGCNFADATDPETITYDDPSAEAKRLVKDILTAGGIQSQTFHLVVGNVNNAKAVAKNGVRYIFYSEAFLQNFKQKSRTYWAAYFLLAHEVGHHALGHNFAEKHTQKRHENEFAADEFATKVLCKLEATYDETVAGIETFDQDKGSDSHPSPSERQKRIADAYRTYTGREGVSITPPTTSVPPTNQPPKVVGETVPPPPVRTFLQLDESAFRHPKNLVTKEVIVAEIDNEKITVKFRAPARRQNQRFKICFLSNDATLIPGNRTPGSISNTGINVSHAPDMTIVWNYRMENYKDMKALSKPNLFKLYVFDMEDLPNAQVDKNALLGLGAILAVGAGVSTLGGIDIGKGKQYYNTVYKKSLTDADYQKADKQYVRGQYLIGGGAVIAGIGIWLLNRKLASVRANKGILCATPLPKNYWEPWASVSSVGVRWHF